MKINYFINSEGNLMTETNRNLPPTLWRLGVLVWDVFTAGGFRTASGAEDFLVVVAVADNSFLNGKLVAGAGDDFSTGRGVLDNKAENMNKFKVLFMHT